MGVHRRRDAAGLLLLAPDRSRANTEALGRANCHSDPNTGGDAVAPADCVTDTNPDGEADTTPHTNTDREAVTSAYTRSRAPVLSGMPDREGVR